MTTKTFKVRAHAYVWCDHHGEIHQAKRDYYQEDAADTCRRANWRRVYVETTDPKEEF